MQAYPNSRYYPPSQYPPQRQQPPPGTYLTGFSASYPHFAQPNPGPPPSQAAPIPQGYHHFPGAYPPREQYETYPVVPQHPPRASKHMHRSHSLAAPHPSAVPLKSAMKRRPHERSGSMNNPPIGGQQMGNLSMSRTSSRAPSEQRERTASTTRRRADSLPHRHGALVLSLMTCDLRAMLICGLRSRIPDLPWFQ